MQIYLFEFCSNIFGYNNKQTKKTIKQTIKHKNDIIKIQHWKVFAINSRMQNVFSEYAYESDKCPKLLQL